MFDRDSTNSNSTPEHLPHILAICPALQQTREKLVKFTISYCEQVPHLSQLVFTFLVPDHPLYCHFLLDCSTIPAVTTAVQEYGNEYLYYLFQITHTWCYNLHRERMKILGRWNII